MGEDQAVDMHNNDQALLYEIFAQGRGGGGVKGRSQRF